MYVARNNKLIWLTYPEFQRLKAIEGKNFSLYRQPIKPNRAERRKLRK